MKKIGLLCLAVVLALGTMGAGLAYWNETLEIGQNLVNTGEMDVRIIHMAPGYWELQKSPNMTGSYSISDDGLSATLTLGNMYPDTASKDFWGVQWRFAMKNFGTIPAKIKDVMLTVDSDTDNLAQEIKTGGLFRHFDVSNTTIDQDTFGVWWPYCSTPLEEMDDGMYGCMDGRVLLPGELFWWGEELEGDGGCVYFRLPSDAPNATEDQTITFTLTFTFTQFNGD